MLHCWSLIIALLSFRYYLLFIFINFKFLLQQLSKVRLFLPCLHRITPVFGIFVHNSLQIKCQKYWPSGNKRSESYGDIRVTLEENLIFCDYTIRTFSVQHKRFPEQRTVIQYHFTAWPDFGVPEHPTPLLRFARKVMSHEPPSAGPMLVHCR